MKFAHLLAALTLEPLCLVPDKARTIIALVEARAMGIATGAVPEFPVRGSALSPLDSSVVAYDDAGDPDEPAPAPLYELVGTVAVIPLEGVIGKRLGVMALMCGGCDVDRLSRALSAAAADGNVSTILLDINSPGGMIIGIPELSAQIAAIRATGKRVVAFSDFQICSAAYWIAAQCDAIFCTPSAQIGCIGAFLACEDNSEAWEMAGRERLIFNGNAKYKAMGTPGKKWTPEEKAFMEARAAKATDAIRAASQVNRDLALEDMQGQSFDGTDALAKNLVDGLVNSRDEMLGRL